jgi:RNA polymerase sigma factor (sigma-70 family)
MVLAADPSDAALIAAMADGLEALDILYERHAVMAFSIARRITGDAALAEDVVQEAFLSAWRNASRYDPARGSVKTWLMALVHHRAIDAIRRRKPTTDLPESDGLVTLGLHVPDVWAEVSAGLDAEAVRRAIAALSDAQRVAIELAYFGGLTQAEIAHRTGIPLGTVKSRMRLGLLSMRLVLSSAEPTGAAAPVGAATGR